MQSRRPLALMVVAFVGSTAGSARAGRCPNIMFVLDRSGSMADNVMGTGAPPSKWKLLQDAVKGVVLKYGDQVPFGMEMFTSSGFNDQQCFADAMIDVEPGHGTAMSIVNMVSAAKPDSGTNTAQAIRRAAEDPRMADKSRAQYIVLITDGDPNCPFDDQTMAKYTVKEEEAAAARSPSIHTFVVGFDGSGGVNPANLNLMAKAGHEPIPGCTGTQQSPCYYSATSAQKFNAAIDKIINQVVGGEFGTTMCDDSCQSNGCPSGQKCVTDEFDIHPHCVPDPCAGVLNCLGTSGDYCRDGICVHACPACLAGRRCVDGTCIADACAGKTCDGGAVCDPSTGQCSDKCIGVTCKAAGSICELATGTCVPDPCKAIQCPPGTTCRYGGNCQTSGDTGDGGAGGHGHAGPGCAVGPVEDAGGVLGALAALAFAAALLRRRRA